MDPIISWFRSLWDSIQDLADTALSREPSPRRRAEKFLRSKPPSKSSPEPKLKAKPDSRPVLKWLGWAALGVFGIAVVLAVVSFGLSGEESSGNQVQYDAYGMPIGGGDLGAAMNPMRGLTLSSLMGGFVLGVGLVAILAFWRWVVHKHGWVALVVLCALLVLIGDTSDSASTTSMASMLAFITGFSAGIALAAKFLLVIRPPTEIPDIFGSSRWATFDDITEADLIGSMDKGDGLFLGKEQEKGIPLVYRGDMHALTVAPTRTGKGAVAIIPNLLRSKSSILVIDPKGENARRTAAKRAAMGHNIKIVDPWGIAQEADKFGPGADAGFHAHFNPLDALRADDPDLGSDAMQLADALVVSTDKEPFWSDEAKALIAGFILYVVVAPEEEGNRTLGRVRDILSLPPAADTEDENLPGTMDEILMRMAVSPHPLVSAAAFRIAQKAEKERSGVISSAQSNTHFLDSPKIRDSLAKSDFRFSDLKTADALTTIYLVLPLDRLSTFNRWLRLMISSAMIDLTRTPAKSDAEPVRVILDEFAALERLKIIETAFGTMAGLGVQLWAVTQDLSQLMRLYGDKGWQTFVSNAGVFQYFGSRDYETAKYAEHLTGMTTMKKRSISFGSSSSATTSYPSSSSTTGHSKTISYDDVQRPLAYADEMMTLHRDLQILFVENNYPIIARKHWWFRHTQASKPVKPKSS